MFAWCYGDRFSSPDTSCLPVVRAVKFLSPNSLITSALHSSCPCYLMELSLHAFLLMVVADEFCYPFPLLPCCILMVKQCVLLENTVVF
jgi:hypothetical protein